MVFLPQCFISVRCEEAEEHPAKIIGNLSLTVHIWTLAGLQILDSRKTWQSQLPFLNSSWWSSSESKGKYIHNSVHFSSFTATHDITDCLCQIATIGALLEPHPISWKSVSIWVGLFLIARVSLRVGVFVPKTGVSIDYEHVRHVQSTGNKW